MLISILQLKHFSNNYQSYSILSGSGRIVKTFLKEPRPQSTINIHKPTRYAIAHTTYSQGKKLYPHCIGFITQKRLFLLIKVQFSRKIRDKAL
jgi:hypothetical protein